MSIFGMNSKRLYQLFFLQFRVHQSVSVRCILQQRPSLTVDSLYLHFFCWNNSARGFLSSDLTARPCNHNCLHTYYTILLDFAFGTTASGTVVAYIQYLSAFAQAIVFEWRAVQCITEVVRSPVVPQVGYL